MAVSGGSVDEPSNGDILVLCAPKILQSTRVHRPKPVAQPNAQFVPAHSLSEIACTHSQAHQAASKNGTRSQQYLSFPSRCRSPDAARFGAELAFCAMLGTQPPPAVVCIAALRQRSPTTL